MYKNVTEGGQKKLSMYKYHNAKVYNNQIIVKGNCERGLEQRLKCIGKEAQ